MTRFNLKCALSLLVWVASAGAQTGVTVTYSYNGYPLYVPVDDANIITIAQVTVPQALKISNLTAKVQIEYPAVGDLNVYLFSPDGTRVKLLERNCGSLVNVDTTFDDAAPSKYADFCPAEAGRGPYRGNEPLSNFNGADSSLGIWRLAIENNGSNSRAGWLKGITLQVTGTPQVAPTYRVDTVLNSASARSGVIVPGENITILGLGLGSADGATAPAGAWPTTLGGTQVSINGTYIPLGYVSNYRIDAQVPFELSTAGPAAIQIQRSGTSGSVVSVNTQATFPGLYTANGLGTGQALANNQNGSVNSKLTPANRGQLISVFASGLGTVSPAWPAGQTASSDTLSKATQQVAASIGGVPAVVYSAALAAGKAPGVYQVRVLIPSDVPAGTRDVVISNGGNGSQSGVTIEVQ